MGPFQGEMERKIEKTGWRLEVMNPHRAPLGSFDHAQGTRWKLLWGFDDDQQAAYETLVEDLNRINAPVQLRIVRELAKKKDRVS